MAVVVAGVKEEVKNQWPLKPARDHGLPSASRFSSFQSIFNQPFTSSNSNCLRTYTKKVQLHNLLFAILLFIITLLGLSS